MHGDGGRASAGGSRWRPGQVALRPAATECGRRVRSALSAAAVSSGATAEQAWPKERVRFAATGTGSLEQHRGDIYRPVYEALVHHLAARSATVVPFIPAVSSDVEHRSRSRDAVSGQFHRHNRKLADDLCLPVCSPPRRRVFGAPNRIPCRRRTRRRCEPSAGRAPISKRVWACRPNERGRGRLRPDLPLPCFVACAVGSSRWPPVTAS